eukprot:CAMPEP_0182913106 /NCGR_PEP_ID=MMETSP0034_2-20130328/37865_1 /TAXON_ID=156128 /ORGANISM="Nephroselmis pyriformis, Strain CCMP717" /LENGTH=85 /DNA_ID=CAMNT_0025049809 /DNA_START=13 /DNA_END=270 /DNA_ORIENTATION=-
MGGKKKAAKPPPKPKAPKLAIIFDCPFCNHDKAVECKIDKDAEVAELNCRICSETFRMQTNKLTEPVDVYYEWIDECERLNKDVE